MFVKLLVAFIGSGSVGVGNLPPDASGPSHEQFYESCWSALAAPHYGENRRVASPETALQMHAICDVVYTQVTGHEAPDARATRFAHDMKVALKALPQHEHRAYIIGECHKVAASRPEICDKIGIELDRAPASL